VLPYDPKDKEKPRLYFTFNGFTQWCNNSDNRYSHLLRKYCTRVTADIHRGDGGQYIRKIAEREETRLPPQITEETIAAMMDKLADEAHKVQSENPECQFPIGISAKTAMALGWDRDYRKLLCRIQESTTLTENFDYKVCFCQNSPPSGRPDGVPSRGHFVLFVQIIQNILNSVFCNAPRCCRMTPKTRRSRGYTLPSMDSPNGATTPTTATRICFENIALV
jgi:hypothetical protein